MKKKNENEHSGPINLQTLTMHTPPIAAATTAAATAVAGFRAAHARVYANLLINYCSIRGTPLVCHNIILDTRYTVIYIYNAAWIDPNGKLIYFLV